jgi:hypothetical protein
VLSKGFSPTAFHEPYYRALWFGSVLLFNAELLENSVLQRYSKPFLILLMGTFLFNIKKLMNEYTGWE